MQNPAITLASRLGMGAALASCLLFGALTGNAQATSSNTASKSITSSDLEALKKDFSAQLEQMKGAYEKRITQLESQLSGIKSQDQAADVALRAENAALKAQDAADKAEKMYSSTLASQQISDLGEDGARFPWRELDDYTKGFEFHGMFRSNFGINGNGGTLPTFEAPLTGGKYTLGNRNDTYGELIFVNHFLQDDLKKEGVKFRTEVLVAYATNKATADGDAKDDKFSAREVFAEVEGLCKHNPKMKLWAGQRYYLNPGFQSNNTDIANYGGYGCGIADFSLAEKAWGKASIAYIGGTFDDLTSDGAINPNPTYAKNNLVISLDEVELPYGKGLMWLTLSGAKGRDTSFATELPCGCTIVDRYASTCGIAAGLVHTAEDFFGGFNQASITAGYGAASNMSAVVNNPFSQLNKSWSFMVSEAFTIQPAENFSVAFVTLAQFSRLGDPTTAPIDDSDKTKGYKVTGSTYKNFKWLSLGIQPVYHFNKYFDIAVEGAIDWTDTKLEGGADGTLFKGTVAFEVSPDWSFSAKPVMRIFATAATWGDGFTGLVGGDAYKNNQGGYGIGAAVEASW